MRALLKFHSLPAGDKIFLLQCLLTVVAVRLGLTFMSYHAVRRWMPPVRGEHSRQRLQRVAWFVPAVSRIVPGATCLTQALAGQMLLARNGVASDVHIGVTSAPDRAFNAHAWLVTDGQVVLGGSADELGRYVPMTTLAPRSH